MQAIGAALIFFDDLVALLQFIGEENRAPG